MSKKTILPEVLPAPHDRTEPTSPRARARRRFESLAKKAALAGAAGSLSACLGYGVVDEVPRPVQCKATDDANTWLRVNIGARDAQNATEIDLLIGEGFPQVADVHFTNFFTVDGGQLVGTPAFNNASLEKATNVSLKVLIDSATGVVVLHTALTCDETPRNIDISIDPATGATQISDAGGTP